MTLSRLGLAALLSIVPATGALACGADSDCPVPLGSYRYYVPVEWDGESALPTLFYFHGWQSSSQNVMANEALGALADRTGTLLVAPDGYNKSWAHQGSPTQGRDERAFLAEVMNDLTARMLLQDGSVFAAGFSQGGSMVWDVACFAPDMFDGYVAIGGAFWEPLPARCDAPVDLIHVHGLSDPVVPIEGRAIRDTFHQGDVFASMGIMREVAGCRENPDAFEVGKVMVERRWSECDSGKTLAMWIHDGGHSWRIEWLDEALSALRQ